MQPYALDSDPIRAAVVGGGSIGVGWAIVFARAGIHVAVFEPDERRRAAIPADVTFRLSQLARGSLLGDSVEVIAARVACTETLDEAIQGVVHVQECAPELLDVKRELFARLVAVTPADVVLASSTSALTASSIACLLPSRERSLVAHPANPPYLLRVVELVPAPFTDPHVLERARELFEFVGMSPVVVRREIEGFVFNRLQGALLREAYCLVRDGVADVGTVDLLVREGLGLRWAVCGPFETAELNSRGGIESHAQKLGPAYARMGAERGQDDPWTTELVARVADELHRRLPLERWDERVAWRNEALIALERARRESGLFDASPGDRM